MEAFDPVETSKKILLKCQYLKEKNKQIPMLVRGEGHLISTGDKSISEVYRTVCGRSLH